MTRNQLKAIKLAHEIDERLVSAGDLPEADWHLLLLAAGSNRALSSPRLIALRVIDHAERHQGYFQRTSAYREDSLVRSLCGYSRPSFGDVNAN